MKKSIIATGAASLALAAMPVVGVFAARTEAGTITDTLNVNIPAGCTIVNGAGDNLPTDGSNPALENSYTVEMQNGEFKTDIGGSADATQGETVDNTIDVSCNTSSSAGAAATWVLTAIGAGEGNTVDLMHTTGTGTDIASGLAEDGATSNWAFKVTKAAAATYAQDYNDGEGGYMAVPTTETDLVSGSGSLSNAFTMNYQVYISQTQATGTYTGVVEYTLYNPAS